MRVGIYPGSFDPITLGHLDIIKRAINIVDVLIVGVLENKNKKNMFSVDERIELIKQTIEDEIEDSGVRERILVETSEGLLADFAKKKRANIIIRGVRNTIDYEYEANMARVNKQLNDNLETVCLITDRKYMDVSSSTVREIASYGGDISEFTPQCVTEYLEDIK